VLALAPGCRSGSRCSGGATPRVDRRRAVRLRADGAGDLGPIRLGVASAIAFAIAWAVVAALAWF
jgi:Na+(H+)/acetate symporter ActP